MLFLVIARHAPGFPPMPPQQELALIKAGIEMWASNPKVKALYGFGAYRGGCAIVEADSAADLNRAVLVNPSAGLYDFEVHPLITAQEIVAGIAESEKMLAQMMPAS